MNLVMIGTFTSVDDAAKVSAIIERLTTQVAEDVQAGAIEMGESTDRVSDGLRELLTELNIYTIGPSELEQFAYEARVRQEENRVVVTTEEADISAFLKLLVAKGARVEVYSAHDFPGTGYGRGR
jgi:hypothetical protein